MGFSCTDDTRSAAAAPWRSFSPCFHDISALIAAGPFPGQKERGRERERKREIER
jgi:hypothetical protein